MQRPLADEIRPQTLDEVVGQRHLLAPGAVLRRLIESETEANMVFYGPSVTGKTTYLINNDVTSASSKNKKARELGIPILSEEDFLKLLEGEYHAH